MTKHKYNYPVVSAKDEGLEEWFKNHLDVAGMAIGAGLNGIYGQRRIVINPYSPVLKTKQLKKGLVLIESIRHKMDEDNYNPLFELTPKLKELLKTIFKDTPYGSDDQAFKRSIISRIAVNDTLDLGVSNELILEALKFKNGKMLIKKGKSGLIPKVAKTVAKKLVSKTPSSNEIDEMINDYTRGKFLNPEQVLRHQKLLEPIIGKLSDNIRVDRIRIPSTNRQIFNNTVFARMRLNRGDQTIGSDFDWNHIYEMPERDFEAIGKGHASGFYRTQTGDIFIKRPTRNHSEDDFFNFIFQDLISKPKTGFHELRHRADSRYPLTQQEQKVLSNAFGDDFIKSASRSNYDATLDMVTTNFDARDKLFSIAKTPGMRPLNKMSLDELNLFIDNATDELITSSIEDSNGYGYRFINYLRKNKLLTPLRILAFRESMKYVPIATFGYFGTTNNN